MSTIQSAEKSSNLVDTLWIPLFSWISIEFHYFRGHAAVISTNFVDKHWIPLFSWTRYNDFHYFLEKPASSAVNVHFLRGIQKSVPTTRTITNKPFLRPRQRSLTVKNTVTKNPPTKVLIFKAKFCLKNFLTWCFFWD